MIENNRQGKSAKSSVSPELLKLVQNRMRLPSDNGPEFTTSAVKKWLKSSDIEALFVATDNPCENGYVESFHTKLRDELLNRELFLHID
jgi:transposase InsO family protein